MKNVTVSSFLEARETEGLRDLRDSKASSAPHTTLPKEAIGHMLMRLGWDGLVVVM